MSSTSHLILSHSELSQQLSWYCYTLYFTVLIWYCLTLSCLNNSFDTVVIGLFPPPYFSPFPIRNRWIQISTRLLSESVGSTSKIKNKKLGAQQNAYCCTPDFPPALLSPPVTSPFFLAHNKPVVHVVVYCCMFPQCVSWLNCSFDTVAYRTFFI